MIIYGTNSTHLKSVVLTEQACPNCNTHGSIVMGSYAKYAHIFWIPFISIGRVGISQCSNCKQVLQKAVMPLELRSAYIRLEQQTKIPFYHFAGAGLLALAIVWGVISSGKTAEMENSYLKDPQRGDVYTIKTEDNYYTTIKLVGVTKDSVFIVQNDKSVSKESGLYKISGDENYDHDTVALPRTKLDELKKENKIMGISRH